MADVTDTREDVAHPFDPAKRDSAGPILNWQCAPDDMSKAAVIAFTIAEFVRHVRGDSILHPQIVQMDLICIHCNGRPQDFDAWMRAGVVQATQEYSLIHNNIDRTCGKLPDFVKLRFDAKN